MERSLICINTCNRLNEVKKYIIPYLQFVHNDPQFHFILSLDGKSDDYMEFCNEYSIPLIFSEEREGVGLSKNRVLQKFPDFDYYFFIEDDIELFNADIFNIHIQLFKETGIHHFGYGLRSYDHVVPTAIGEVTCGWKGGAQFNFFTQTGIRKCGGWHTYFARYKRFGHTEHSYRFYFNELNPRPFCVYKNINKLLIFHDPPHVTNVEIETNKNELIKEEQDMIDQKQTFVPVAILSAITFNDKNIDCSEVSKQILEADKYFFLTKQEKRKTLSHYYFYLFFEHSTNFLKRTRYFVYSLFLDPTSNQIKHYLKHGQRI